MNDTKNMTRGDCLGAAQALIARQLIGDEKSDGRLTGSEIHERVMAPVRQAHAQAVQQALEMLMRQRSGELVMVLPADDKLEVLPVNPRIESERR